MKSLIRNQIDHIKNIARKSDVGSSQHAAILIDGKYRKIISYGYNKHHVNSNGCEKDRNGNFTIHAEANAIFQAIKYIKNSKSRLIIYVLKIRKDGSLGNSKPCIDCQRVCNKYNIQIVYYST